MAGLLVIGIGVALIAIFGKNREATQSRPAIECVRRWEVPLPLPIARQLVGGFLCVQLGYVLEAEGDDGIDFFIRGNRRITRLPSLRTVGWGDVPRLACVGFGMRDGLVRMCLMIRPVATLAIAQDTEAFFLNCAGKECDAVFDLLRSAVVESKRANQKARASHGGSAPPASPQVASSDLETLGVKAGASWPEIQAAYRNACMKYHPDRLAGQNIAPHLAELAVRRFTEITAAYDRLRRNRSAA